MYHSIEIIEEARETSLLSLHDAKLGLNMTGASQFTDDQIELMVEWASNELATMCNRVFARETLIETVLELDGGKIFLSHYPVKEIIELNENGTILVPGTDYNLDKNTGILKRMSGTLWSVPVSIKYTGGYDLPNRAPPELASACVLLTRETYHAALRGDASIRMISHKGNRVMYFDPNAANKSSGGSMTTAGTPAKRAVQDLVKSFTRFVV